MNEGGGKGQRLTDILWLDIRMYEVTLIVKVLEAE
jgi:hypothetical protein